MIDLKERLLTIRGVVTNPNNDPQEIRRVVADIVDDALLYAKLPEQRIAELENQHQEFRMLLSDFVQELQSYPLEHLGALVINAEQFLNSTKINLTKINSTEATSTDCTPDDLTDKQAMELYEKISPLFYEPTLGRADTIRELFKILKLTEEPND